MKIRNVFADRGRALARVASLAGALALLTVPAVAMAHVPFFLEGDGPFAVDEPTVSKAFYDWLSVGTAHVYEVPPVGRPIPLQLLVLDDATGAQVEHRVTVACPGEDPRELATLDVAYTERFSGIAHRIRARGAMGPTDAACTVTLRQLAGPPAPYTFSIGDEERFTAADMVGLLRLNARLERWGSAP